MVFESLMMDGLGEGRPCGTFGEGGAMSRFGLFGFGEDLRLSEPKENQRGFSEVVLSLPLLCMGGACASLGDSPWDTG
jgi:hypothetical protein